MRLEQLALRLEQAGCGTRGKDIYLHFMPASVKKGIVLLPKLAGDPVDWELIGFSCNHGFQLIVRDPNVPDGYARSDAAVKALTILSDTLVPALGDLPAINVRFLRPKHETIVYPRSPANYFEFSVNFETAYSVA